MRRLRNPLLALALLLGVALDATACGRLFNRNRCAQPQVCCNTEWTLYILVNGEWVEKYTGSYAHAQETACFLGCQFTITAQCLPCPPNDPICTRCAIVRAAIKGVPVNPEQKCLWICMNGYWEYHGNSSDTAILENIANRKGCPEQSPKPNPLARCTYRIVYCNDPNSPKPGKPCVNHIPTQQER